MYEFQVKNNGSDGEVALQGSLTIQNIQLIKEFLSVALEKVSELTIDHTKATGFDITYIQLLIAFCNSALLTGKTVRWNYPKPFVSFITDLGLSGCKYFVNNEPKELNNV